MFITKPNLWIFYQKLTMEESPQSVRGTVYPELRHIPRREEHVG